MTWFWMNHFSVYSGKGSVRWVLADYEDKAVRPHALGKFRDLLMATVTSPAMLEYLDNAQSAVNRINENYARELMELHTLGVAGGPSGSRYTQQDVQELARVLTGLGINASGEPPKLAPQKQALYRAGGLFEFNPNRHDFGAKTLLGHRIEPSGFHEVEQAVEILSRDPATARFISYKLAVHFVGDAPPPSLVNRMAGTFTQTDGDIAAVLRTLFLSPELNTTLASGTRKFRTRCSSWLRRCAWRMTAARWPTCAPPSAGLTSLASRSMAASRRTASRQRRARGPVLGRWSSASRSRAP